MILPDRDCKRAYVWLAAIFAAFAGTSYAATPFYLGDWRVAGATRAPWADPAHPLDDAEPARLRGHVIAIRPRGINGPPPFPCPAAHYRLTDYAADMLFQGAFGEMHAKTASVDPVKVAAGLGFHNSQTRTLETGCEFDFHFVDATHAQVGLNDYVYHLKKQ